MYTQAVSYIDAMTHSSSYYTDAQAAARYFTSATDGSGSGMICATWDGYTADQALGAMGAAPGVVAIWAGSQASIPAGWLLCNGANGTPNLTNRFIVGAGNHYAQGATGGSNVVTTTATVTIAGHALTAAEIPLHTHSGIVDYYAVATQTGGGNVANQSLDSATNANRYTSYTGSGSAHSHTASFAGTSNQVKRPAFYTLCYIMKS